MEKAACAQSLNLILLFVTPWTVAYQAPLSMGFSRQEYWTDLPFPLPRVLPDSGIEPVSLPSPVRAGGLFTPVPPGRPKKQDSGPRQLRYISKELFQ